MPRPPRIDRPVHKNVNIPESVATKVDLELYSAIEERVPHGAWSSLLTELLNDWLKKRGIA
jgi:hypothetical protein